MRYFPDDLGEAYAFGRRYPCEMYPVGVKSGCRKQFLQYREAAAGMVVAYKVMAVAGVAT